MPRPAGCPTPSKDLAFIATFREEAGKGILKKPPSKVGEAEPAALLRLVFKSTGSFKRERGHRRPHRLRR